MKRNRMFPLVSLAAAFVACAGQPAPQPFSDGAFVYPASSWERVDAPESARYSSEELASLTEYVETLNTTGLLEVVGGEVLFEYGDLGELSYLASVRKSILAMLYGNYVADGSIDLSKTMGDLEMNDHGGLLASEEEATIEHLITARSGVYHPASNGGDSSADAPPRGSQEPGTYFLYNNWDFNAAGAAFEKESGRDIYDALETDLAIPIGMQDFERSEQEKSGNLQRSLYPAYHIWLSTRDMARIGYLMLREGNWAVEQIVPRDWVGKITSIVTPVEEMNPEGVRQGPFGYGYMWWVWDGPQAEGAFQGAYSARGAYGQFITVLPELDMVLAHKTAIPPQRTTQWGEYMGIIERLIAARSY